MKTLLYSAIVLLVLILAGGIEATAAQSERKSTKRQTATAVPQEKAKTESADKLPDPIATRRQELQKGVASATRKKLDDAGRELAEKGLLTEETMGKEASRLVRKQFPRASSAQKKSLEFLVLCASWESVQARRAETKVQAQECTSKIESLDKKKRELLAKKKSMKQSSSSGDIATRGESLQLVEQDLAGTSTELQTLNAEYLQLQQMTQKQTQMLTMLSSLLRTQHDTANAIIRNIR